MAVKKAFYSALEAGQIHALVQPEEEGQVGGGVPLHHIGKINLQVGQGIDRPGAVVHRRGRGGGALQLLQLQDGGVGHELIQSQVHPQGGGQIGEQHDASQGVQARLIEVGVNAEAAVSQGGGDQVGNPALDLSLRLKEGGALFLLSLFLAEIPGAYDLLGGGFLKGHLPEMAF